MLPEHWRWSIVSEQPMIQYSTLQGAEVDSFRWMTFPAYRQLLELKQPRPSLVGARAGGLAIGLALAVADSRETEAELLSIYLHEEYRNQGVASALMERTFAELSARGVKTARGCYMTGQSATSAVERLLAKTGWSEPQTRKLVLRCTLDSVSGAPWIDKFRKLPAGYTIVPWVGVTAQERAWIVTSNDREHWIADDLNPFKFERDIEPVTSLALRHRGVIVGWCLNHVVDGVLRFSCSFMHPGLARLGRIFLLYSEAVTRMRLIGIAQGMWTIPTSHSAFALFAKRWMRPYSTFFGETRGVCKTIVLEK